MNERMKELIKESNGYWEYGDGNMPVTVCFQEADLEKFVGLVVQELINAVESYVDDYEVIR